MTTDILMPSSPSDTSLNYLTSRPRSPTSPTTTTSAFVFRVIIASNAPLPSLESLAAAGRELGPSLRPYDVRVNEYLPYFSTESDWDSTARVLTDQYSPANLLSNQ